MILKRIRLHPFGRTIDRTYDLTRPVSVFLGPNEAGKSTLRQALQHALFTSTQLTDKQAEATFDPWYPKPDGDHVAVTLVFTHDGVEWTLTKRWGAGKASSLTAAGAAAIGDPAAVQGRLAAFLGHNEATGRHVLYTGQAELLRTMVALKDAIKANQIKPAADLLAAVAGGAYDLGPERLRTALEGRIKAQFGRWANERGGPELDKGKERGPAYPWKQDVGPILKAWYAWQAKAAERRELDETERRLDGVSTALAALEAQMAADRDFLTRGGPLRDGLGERRVLEAELQGHRVANARMAEIMLKWPNAEAGAAAARKQLDDLQTSRRALVVEQENAARRAEAEAKQVEYKALCAARDEWLAAAEAVQRSFEPPVEVVAELERLTERIKDARNRIEAQKLAYEIAAREPFTIRIAEAAEPSRDVPVRDRLSGVARSRLRIEAGPLTVTVSSGEEDVAVLFTDLEHDVARERSLLATCREESLVDVKAQVKRHGDLVTAAALRKTAAEAALRGKAFEQWQEEIAALANLPQTRGVGVIAAEIARIDHAIGVENGTVRLHEENIRLWTDTYTTQQRLLDALVEQQSLIRSGETRLQALPTVPEGFATTEAFLQELARREEQNQGRPVQLVALVAERQELRDSIGDRSAAELADEAAHLEQVFQRELRIGQAYERIREVLDEVMGEREADPLAGFTAKVTDWFRSITGGQDALGFEGDVPKEVTRGDVALPPARLSQGAGSALALVLRLALAEVHLGAKPGFVVLDDPFVDLDSERRERAKGLLLRFAERHQVIFITCHEPHAAGLGEPTVITR